MFLLVLNTCTALGVRPSDVVTWFLTMSKLVEWVESFCTLGNETMIIVDESNVVSEIGFFRRCGKSGKA